MKRENTWIRSIFSKTLLIFYGTLLIVMIAVTIIYNIDNIKFNFSIDWQNKEPISKEIITESLKE